MRRVRLRGWPPQTRREPLLSGTIVSERYQANMGGKQSRVVSSDVAEQLRPEDEHEGETQASIRLTPALIDQINGTHEATAKAKQAASVSAQYGSCGFIVAMDSPLQDVLTLRALCLDWGI
ncbi:hypothetical protein BBJ28_00010202 [Nothophytophthora sp. Chile5]|nr:hypothetical protein BBJ28_00010202 [Nothophytophthora sp. Chile5]